MQQRFPTPWLRRVGSLDPPRWISTWLWFWPLETSYLGQPVSRALGFRGQHERSLRSWCSHPVTGAKQMPGAQWAELPRPPTALQSRRGCPGEGTAPCSSFFPSFLALQRSQETAQTLTMGKPRRRERNGLSKFPCDSTAGMGAQDPGLSPRQQDYSSCRSDEDQREGTEV